MQTKFLNRGLIIAISVLCFSAAFASENPKESEGRELRHQELQNFLGHNYLWFAVPGHGVF